MHADPRTSGSARWSSTSSTKRSKCRSSKCWPTWSSPASASIPTAWASSASGTASGSSNLEQEIEELAGHPLNIGSPKQLAQVLFQELGLPVVKKTKTGPSTDADVLEQLADLHPLPAKIVEYRQYAKLKNTYVDALPTMIHPETGRVHASFNQVVAATGRLSSSDPNLQNIPIRTEEGREIRSAFVAQFALPSRRGLGRGDEPLETSRRRLLANRTAHPGPLLERRIDVCRVRARRRHSHACRQPGLRRAARRSHVRPTPQAPKPSTSASSTVKARSASPRASASRRTKRPSSSTATSPPIAASPSSCSNTLDECRRKGYVSTILGRRRAIKASAPSTSFHSVTDRPSRRPLTLPERTVVNSVIQGSAADMIKLAMIAIHRRLRDEKLDAKMLLQIHDELVFEVSPETHRPARQTGPRRNAIRDATPRAAQSRRENPATTGPLANDGSFADSIVSPGKTRCCQSPISLHM